MFNQDLARDLPDYDKETIRISSEYDPNLDQAFAIDINGEGETVDSYFYASEYERDADYQALKDLGFRN